MSGSNELIMHPGNATVPKSSAHFFRRPRGLGWGMLVRWGFEVTHADGYVLAFFRVRNE